MAKSQQLDPENPFFEVFVCPELGILRCGGIEIFGEYSSIFGWNDKSISVILNHSFRTP